MRIPSPCVVLLLLSSLSSGLQSAFSFLSISLTSKHLLGRLAQYLQPLRMAEFDGSGPSTTGPVAKSTRYAKYIDSARIEAAKKFPADLKLSFTDIRCTQQRIKCYVLSDLHADAEKNQIWVRENCQRLPEDENIFTIFILPGDIGSEIDRLESVFRVLMCNYNAVIYVPGNHEAWRRGTASGGSATQPELRSDNRMAVDSVKKLAEVVECARACGVHVGPIRIQKIASDDPAALHVSPQPSSTTTAGVTIFPLYSWYHADWDTEPDLDNETYLAVEEVMPFTKKWGDFAMCTWPEDLLLHSEFASIANENTVLAEAFAGINEPFLNPVGAGEEGRLPSGTGKKHASMLVQEDDTVISFSHFLPRQELCPEKRFLIEPLLSRVVGSDPLEAQVRRLNPHLHLFGHTHIPIDLELDGIRYLQWPLGYSREADKQCAPVHAVGALMIYDSACGTGKEGIPPNLPSLTAAWTNYYRNNARNPLLISPLAPWVLQRLDGYAGLVANNPRKPATLKP